ncbi:diphosphomevalonate decarboxylase [Companilactobacillus metriopterae]|uniref:diphosphomevalonate decarboxylase n=1 Tax=Companilactobacillus metriopterae TaxID=1909267 RepID=UPI00100C1459|nr:diphosphomevalonate decarboxylase [Companilactobacillus metriopterae]
MTKTSRAYTNIALIKYWGKADEQYKIPYTGSLSLTLDKFYTDTTVEIIDSEYDQFILDGQIVDNTRISKYLDFVRNEYGFDNHLKIISENHVPTSAGFASSASGYAALAGALNSNLNLGLNQKELSILARNGSGSASRSVYGGFVEWQAGNSNETSFAIPIDENPKTDLMILSVILNENKKDISSTQGMRLSAATSPFYGEWKNLVNRNLEEIKSAILANDIQKIGEISEHNAMSMHALTISSNPTFTYFSGNTLRVIELVKELRTRGILAYCTIDAGPNVKIITDKNNIDIVDEYIKNNVESAKTVQAKIGPGLRDID